MTIDARLERLVERHEALAQSVEMLRASVHEQGENIAKQGANIDKQSANIDRVLAALRIDGENIAALARVAEAHQARLERLEGGAA